VLRGAHHTVTVHLDGGDLDVGVGEDLKVTLTGWAKPVYAGVLSDELVEELREAQ
jgi:diaminopimelate epimerase